MVEKESSRFCDLRHQEDSILASIYGGVASLNDAITQAADRGFQVNLHVIPMQRPDEAQQRPVVVVAVFRVCQPTPEQLRDLKRSQGVLPEQQDNGGGAT